MSQYATVPLNGRVKIHVAVPESAKSVRVLILSRRDSTAWSAHNETGPDPAYAHLEYSNVLGVRIHQRLPLVLANQHSHGSWQWVFLKRPPYDFFTVMGTGFGAGLLAMLDASYVRRVGGFLFTLAGHATLEWGSEIGDLDPDMYGPLSDPNVGAVCEVEYDVSFS